MRKVSSVSTATGMKMSTDDVTFIGTYYITFILTILHMWHVQATNGTQS